MTETRARAPKPAAPKSSEARAARPARAPSGPAAIHALHRKAGNRAVGRLLAAPPVGRVGGLHLGPVNDRFEREADRVATTVVQRIEAADGAGGRVAVAPAPVGGIQRAPAPGPTPAASTPGPRLPAGGGHAMPAAVRAPMERAFGHSFTGVRLHTGPTAHRLTRSVGARAMTTGRDVYLGRGEYQPHTRAGRTLLAHELTHVLQQRGNPAGYVQRKVGFEFQAPLGVKGHNPRALWVSQGDHPDEYVKRGVSSEHEFAPSIDPTFGGWITDGGDIEFVCKPVDETEAGRENIVAQARNAQKTIAAQVARAQDITLIGKKRRRKSATICRRQGASHLALLWNRSEGDPRKINLSPQITVGLSLENLSRLISAQVDPSASSPMHGVLGFKGGRAEAPHLHEAMQTIDRWVADEEAKVGAPLAGLGGIVKVVAAIVVTSAYRNLMMSSQQTKYLKYLAPWMNRTSLGDAYGLLSEPEREAFAAFRREGVLDDVAHLKLAYSGKESDGPWALHRLQNEASDERARGITTGDLLDTIADGRDPFVAIEGIGIGEINETANIGFEKYGVDRSTDIGLGMEGDDRMGMIVEIREVGHERDRVTLAEMPDYVDRVMAKLLDPAWRSGLVVRTRPARPTVSPSVDPSEPEVVEDTSSSTTGLDDYPRMLPAPSGPVPMAPLRSSLPVDGGGGRMDPPTPRRDDVLAREAAFARAKERGRALRGTGAPVSSRPRHLGGGVLPEGLGGRPMSRLDSSRLGPVRDRRHMAPARPRAAELAVGYVQSVIDEARAHLGDAPLSGHPGFEDELRDVWAKAGRPGKAAIIEDFYRGRFDPVPLDRILGWHTP